MEITKHQQGICPKCGSEKLNYDSWEVSGEAGYYPYVCGDCEFEGQEWYMLKFDSHYKDDGTGEPA